MWQQSRKPGRCGNHPAKKRMYVKLQAGDERVGHMSQILKQTSGDVA